MTDHLKTLRESLENLQGLCSEQSDFVEQITVWTPEALTALDALDQAMRGALTAGKMPPDAEECRTAAVELGGWLSAALEDPTVCAEYKQSINAWFNCAMPYPPAQQAQPSEGRTCTCHPDDNPPVPCAKKYALSECKQAQAEAVPDVVGISGDKLSEFRIDQWWFAELEAAVKDGTTDQKRAVFVVRNLLETLQRALHPLLGAQQAEAVPQIRTLIADDAFACLFKTMVDYRASVLRYIDAVTAPAPAAAPQPKEQN